MHPQRDDQIDSAPMDPIELRNPTVEDAAAIHKLVTDGGVLDANSCYAYLLMCSHFAATTVVACRGAELVGFVTAYIPPRQSDTVFVWQIGVAATARKQGLGRRMLGYLLTLPACRAVRFLEATVSPSNEASQRLFQSLAAQRSARFETGVGFGPHLFSNRDHEDEPLVRVGPME